MTEDLEAQIWEINDSYVAEMWDGITAPKGWYKLIVDTHDKLYDIFPRYEIHQVKEKFGRLRYYSSFQGTGQEGMTDEQIEKARKIIMEAELKSCEICQFCGSEDAGLMCGGMWYVTACGNCAVENELEACEPEVE